VPAEVNHYTVQRVIDINANLQGRDSAQSAAAFRKRLMPRQAAHRNAITCMAQVRGNESIVRSLALGLILAIVLVYLLIVVLFQSWLDPFIIMIAVPGAAGRNSLDAGINGYND